ncbi:MAG: dephospho-CoA kinase, partial [Bdellovibrionales bacterium]|nr:dephospho-CoA kinase [Bdellovibrionales bacterium]
FQKAQEFLEAGAKCFGKILLLTTEQIKSLPFDLQIFDLLEARFGTVKDCVLSENTAVFPSSLGLEVSDLLPLRRWQVRHQQVPHRIVGVTGTIGSGKSTVARILGEQGAIVLSADSIAKDLQAPGREGYQAIVDRFGPTVLDSAGRIDRGRLSKIVFADPEQRKTLEALLHPLIRRVYIKTIEKELECLERPTLFVYDAPLLFESQSIFAEIEHVVVVSAPVETCIDRALIRTPGATKIEIEARIKAQMPLDQKEALADTIIQNESTMESLRSSVDMLFLSLMDGLRFV